MLYETFCCESEHGRLDEDTDDDDDVALSDWMMFSFVIIWMFVISYISTVNNRSHRRRVSRRVINDLTTDVIGKDEESGELYSFAP